MSRAFAFWAVKCVAIPVTWYASAVFLVAPAMPGPLAEFLSGALVLVIWAVIADWPFGTR